MKKILFFLFAFSLTSTPKAQANIGANVYGYGTYAGNLSGGQSALAPSLGAEVVHRFSGPKADGELGVFVTDIIGTQLNTHSWSYGVVANIILGKHSGFSLGVKFDPAWLAILAVSAISPTAVSNLRPLPLGIGLEFGYKLAHVWPRMGIRAVNTPNPSYLGGSSIQNILALDLGLAISL